MKNGGAWGWRWVSERSEEKKNADVLYITRIIHARYSQESINVGPIWGPLVDVSIF